MNMRDLSSTFKGKRVFITGHTGFKGSWLAFLLKEIGAEVMGFALSPTSNPNHFGLLKLEQKIHNIFGNLLDAETLSHSIESFQPEYVFHLAAQALVKTSYEDPVNTIATNVLGSAHLLEAVRKCESVRSLVYITSDKCYENVEWIWGYRENDRLGGYDPYSASKAAAEVIFSAYAHSYFYDRPMLGAATARAGNVIGGGDWAVGRIVPDCIRASENGHAIQLRNPTATRPWQHVLEPLSGYLLLAARLREEPHKYSGSWNFGPSTQQVRTVYQVANKLISYLGSGQIECTNTISSLPEAQLLQLNCDKAHQFLGWYPRWTVEKTIEETAEWYKKLLQGEQAENITRTQIDVFFRSNHD